MRQLFKFRKAFKRNRKQAQSIFRVARMTRGKKREKEGSGVEIQCAGSLPQLGARQSQTESGTSSGRVRERDRNEGSDCEISKTEPNFNMRFRPIQEVWAKGSGAASGSSHWRAARPVAAAAAAAASRPTILWPAECSATTTTTTREKPSIFMKCPQRGSRKSRFRGSTFPQVLRYSDSLLISCRMLSPDHDAAVVVDAYFLPTDARQRQSRRRHRRRAQ